MDRENQGVIKRRLAAQFGVDTTTIDSVVNHAFQFLRAVMRSSDDLRPVKFEGFGTFMVKPIYASPGKKRKKLVLKYGEYATKTTNSSGDQGSG